MKKDRHARRHVLLLLPVLCAVLGGCDLARWLPSSHAAEGDARPATALVHKGAAITVPAASPLRKSLRIATVEQQSVTRLIPVPGVIEADASRLVRIVPPVAGRLEQIYRHLGDTVKVGDALLTLDSADVALAYSDAGKAQAALTLAQRNLERQKELRAADISARKDLEQAESDYAQAASESERSKARLAQLGGALGTGSARHFTLRAPLSGQVIELNGAQGGFWNDTNAPVMVLADLSSVWLAASVQEKDLAAVFVGQAAEISLHAYPGEHIAGKVRYVGAVLEAETRTVKVRIAVDNSAGRIKPGMFAQVSFSAAAHQALVVPAAALVQNGTQTRVFVETSPWTFEARPVTTGAQVGDRIEIVSGLQPGVRIVAKEGVLLND
ncbi:MAG: efflux RND transporter periplasmic adaptor subunit [Pseudomonadota bacterium]